MASLADYVEQVRTWVEEVPVAEKPDPVLQEEIVDKITRSIRQTAATGSHFSKMLSPEEEEIMRENRKDGTVIIKVHEALLFTGDILRIAKRVTENGVNSNHEA